MIQLIEEGILRNSFTEQKMVIQLIEEGNYSRAGLKCLLEDFGTLVFDPGVLEGKGKTQI